LGRYPSDSELLQALQVYGIDAEKLSFLRLNSRVPLSLEIEINPHKDYKDKTTLSDILETHDPLIESKPFKMVELSILNEDIRNLLNKLPPPQGDVIWYKFGLDNGDPNGRSLEMVASILKLPREQVRALETKALRTLKTEPFYKYLIDYAIDS